MPFLHGTFYILSNSPFSIPEFGDGHYWQNSNMLVEVPLRFIGDEDNPSNVIVEMSGTIVWRTQGGFFEGVTFRRPKISSGELSSRELLRVESKGKLNMVQSVFDNEGSSGNVATLFGPGNKGRWERITVQHGAVGISMQHGARLELHQVRIIFLMAWNRIVAVPQYANAAWRLCVYV
jgi:hypothetical protein